VTTTTTAAPQALLPPAEVSKALKAIVAEMSLDFKERRTCLQAMTLAVLSKEHGFILGPPGTGKSMLVRSFFERITGALYFEAILSKTRAAEAILGPYDIPALRDHGHLFRKYKGHLPDCNFAMLDEIGKMSATLGHDMLAVTNERRLHQVNGGRSWIDVPLYTFFGGSNEVPTEESDDAAAMWDRMLVRIVVDVIQETGNWISMLVDPISNAGTRVDFPSLANVIDNEVPKVRLPHDVMQTVADLRAQLRAAEVNPSDRRWKASMKLLKANAFLEGRDEATADDIEVLRHSLWETPSQIKQVERLTLSVSNPVAEKALGLLERAEELSSEARNSKDLATDKRAALGLSINGRLKVLSTELSELRQRTLATGSSTTKLDEVAARLGGIKQQVYSEVLGIDDLK